MHKNIILIGFMGSGKSTVGKQLALSLVMDFIDMDDITLALSKRKSIAEIFTKDGEIVFRELEIKAAKQLAGEKNIVIASGGGVIQNKIIIDYLGKNGTIIFLDTTFEEIVKRIGHMPNRPLFQDTAKAKALYASRSPLYTAYAHMRVQTDNKDISKIVHEIVERSEN